MHPIRKQRLQIILLVLLFATLAAGLIIYVLGQNANFFYTPSQIKNDEYRKGSTLRVGGMVVEDSIKRFDETLAVEFTLTDGNAFIAVVFDGILPDLFAENEAAIATGVIKDSGELIASQVLAKHDENYTPPELTETMDYLKSTHYKNK